MIVSAAAASGGLSVSRFLVCNGGPDFEFESGTPVMALACVWGRNYVLEHLARELDVSNGVTAPGFQRQ